MIANFVFLQQLKVVFTTTILNSLGVCSKADEFYTQKPDIQNGLMFESSVI
jgi:hypothetical protein